MKAFVNTNGCSLGRLMSMRVREFLLKNDETIEITEAPSEADLIIFYACGLTDLSERASKEILSRIKREARKSSRLVIWGCLSKIDPELVARLYEGPMIGPRNTTFFDELFDNLRQPYRDTYANTLVEAYDRFCGMEYKNLLNESVLARLQKWVDKYCVNHDTGPLFYIRVAEGCVGNCSFCSEKLAFGHVKSKAMENILEEFRFGLEKGYKRFFLCAEDLGAYGADNDSSCVELLKAITDTFKSQDYTIIMDQLTPDSLASNFDGFFDIFGTNRIELLGCQVQSGSNRILELMNRKYRAEDWRSAMLQVQAAFPGIRLESHFMVGFPGETEEDFRATLKLLDYPLFIQGGNIYVFSPKERVRASRLPDQVDEKTKLQRRARLWRKQKAMYCLHRFVRKVRGNYGASPARSG